MDAETAETIALLGNRIDSLDASLRAHIDVKFEQSLRYTDAKFEQAQRHTDEKFAEARRHAEVLTENVRDDIRLVAEGLATLIVKVDSLGR